MRKLTASLVTVATLLVTAPPLSAQESVVVEPPIGGGPKGRAPGSKPSIEITDNACEVDSKNLNLKVTTTWEDSNSDPEEPLPVVTNFEAKLLIKSGNGRKYWMEARTTASVTSLGLISPRVSELALCVKDADSGYYIPVAAPGAAISALVSLTTQDGTVFSATCEDDPDTPYIDESDNEIPNDIVCERD